jgi:TRAP-type C4-dicarboxylate transport system permease small subunit
VQAPVTGASVAIFYGAGVVFAVSAGFMLLRDLVRTVSGRLAGAELVMVQESEELAHVKSAAGEPQ